MSNFRISSIINGLSDLKLFFITATVSLIIKCALFLFPFYGLEYEDAFIFTDVGRSVNINYDFSYEPYQTNICEIGTLKNCESSATYGGHFMVFPLLIAGIDKVFGYSPLNVLLLNAILSLLVLFISLRIVKLIIPGNKLAIFFSGLFIATTPFFSIFNTSGLSETFSSIFVITSVYLYIRNTTGNYYKTGLILTIIFLSFCFLIKRENLILLSLPIIDLVILLFEKRKLDDLKRPLIIALVSVALGLTAFLILHVPGIESEEGVAINSSTFSVKYALLLLPTFLKSLLSINYFGLLGLLFLSSPILFFLTSKRHLRILIVLSWLFILMYSLHYRGYYFVKYDDISTFDTLRFYTNFFPILCLSVILFLFLKFQSRQKLIKLIMVLSILVNCFYYFTTRKHLSEIENYERINPVLTTLKFLKPKDIILTDVPIIFHIFCSDSLYIIDYNIIDTGIGERINSLKKDHNIYILQNNFDVEDRLRYPGYFKFLNSTTLKPIMNISEKYYLKQIF